MKDSTFRVSTLVLLVALCASVLLHNPKPVEAQTGAGLIGWVYSATLSGCTWPNGFGSSPTAALICVYPNGSTPGLAIAFASAGPEGTFTPFSSGSSGIFPQSITASSGFCLTAYSAATGLFTTGACLNSLTKAAVLGTGVAAVTASTSTTTTTSTTTLQ